MTHWLVQFSGVLKNKNKKVGPLLLVGLLLCLKDCTGFSAC